MYQWAFNCCLTGMRVNEVEDLKKAGYNAETYYNKNEELKLCIDQIRDGYFSPHNPDEFKDIHDVLMKYDRWVGHVLKIIFLMISFMK